MNIQQFYQQSAQVSLNASLVAFIPSIALLFYAYFIAQNFQLSILVIPFLIYSFFCYQKFLINKNRAKEVKLSLLNNEPSRGKIFEKKLLITFMPAPSLRMIFFTPNGMKAGEIRDESFLFIRWFFPNFIDKLLVKKYVLYDDLDRPIAFYRDLKDRILISSSNHQEMAVIYKTKNGNKKEFFFETMSILVNNNSLQDYSFFTPNGTELAKVQTGWMPLEWGQRFVDPNTPILSMKEDLSESESIQLFSLFITLYKYVNH